MRDLAAFAKYAVALGPDGGAFRIPCRKTGSILQVIASDGGGWDHVSVSHPMRIPLYAEMDMVARLFFRADETVMQLHVPLSDHINVHPRCLHLWRPQEVAIPRPPNWMVG